MVEARILAETALTISVVNLAMTDEADAGR